MRRLSLVTTTLAVCVSALVVLAAAERATFILTDGERISGVLAYHTETAENLIANDFNLAVVPGQPEQVFHYAQVAVIDFIGGTPKTTELAALPASGHMMAMRNGETKQGHFVNIISGVTVRWQASGGGSTDYNVTDVARIYLNPDSARNTFNYTKPAPAPTPAPTPPADPTAPGRNRRGGNGTGVGSGTANGNGNRNGNNDRNGISVAADRDWTDTGIDVQRGDRITFSATGQIRFLKDSPLTAGPGGNADYSAGRRYPVRSLPVGALIGRIEDGTPFAIGASQNSITMRASGRLMLGVNDDGFTDNSGSFVVTVTRVR